MYYDGRLDCDRRPGAQQPGPPGQCPGRPGPGWAGTRAESEAERLVPTAGPDSELAEAATGALAQFCGAAQGRSEGRAVARQPACGTLRVSAGSRARAGRAHGAATVGLARPGAIMMIIMIKKSLFTFWTT